LRELVKCGLQILSNFSRDHVGTGQVGRILKAFVFQPENVKVDLVALEKVLIGEAFEAFDLFARVAVLCVITGDEVV
jgi:hypothetical protein